MGPFSSPPPNLSPWYVPILPRNFWKMLIKKKKKILTNFRTVFRRIRNTSVIPSSPPPVARRNYGVEVGQQREIMVSLLSETILCRRLGSWWWFTRDCRCTMNARAENLGDSYLTVAKNNIIMSLSPTRIVVAIKTVIVVVVVTYKADDVHWQRWK